MRWFGAAAIALVPALVAVTVPAAALASSSATVAVRAVAGERTVSLAWDPVASADHYVVEYAHDGAAPTVQVGGTSTVLSGLVDHVHYAVRVTAVAADGSTLAVSTPLDAVPTSAQPVAVTDVKARPGAPGTVVVRFSGGARFARVGVVASTSSSMTTHPFHTGWYPATTRSIVVPVPKDLKWDLGSTTGNPVYLKVVQSNAASAGSPKSPHTSKPHEYKVSHTVWSMAGPLAADRAGTTALSVAEYNVQSVSVSRAFGPDLQWRKRAPRVVKTIAAAHPDLLLTAEMTTAKLDPACRASKAKHTVCATQADDLAKRLKQHGLRWATSDSPRLAKAAVAKHREATVGAQILYDPSALTLRDHGYLSSKYDLKVKWPHGTPDRWFAWARFTVRADGREIVAVAGHFKQGHDAATARLRKATATKVVGAVRRIAAGRPVVFAGDFNADPSRDPMPPSRLLLKAGYTDAAATTHRSNARYPTVNGAIGSDHGYPSSVSPRQYAASRIDYIMLSGGLRSFGYENVVRRKAGSHRLDPAYHGSDHYMQTAEIGVPDQP